MIDLVRRWWPLAFITLAALWLRTHDLARRPMHADEANQAVKTGELLEQGRYAFDPRDHHGPTLYYLAAGVARLRGEKTLADMSEITVRLVPAVFGAAGVVLLAFIGRRLLAGDAGSAGIEGPPWPALAAAAFMAVSPPAVYYSRYFIQETLLLTFTLAAIACALAWSREHRPRWAIAGGAFVGLMQATKASAPLFVVITAFAALFAAAVAPRTRMLETSAVFQGGGGATGWRAIGLAALAAIATALLLYSSFGTNPGGVADALRAYSFALARFGADAAPTGHEKPWWYYLQLFGWHRQGGLVWQQLAFSALAIAGFAVSIARIVRREGTTPPPRRKPIAAMAAYTLLVIAAFSLFAYKTPWHAIHFVPGMALLASAALAAVGQLRTCRFVALGFALVTLGTLYQQTARAAFLRPADPRNPYAYVHSSPDVLKYRALAEAALARHPGEPIRVISEEYWPLPWYFRGLPNVGYWSSVPEQCDGALIIASQATADAVRARLHGAYHESFLGLRPEFVCILFTPVRDEGKGSEGVREEQRQP